MPKQENNSKVYIVLQYGNTIRSMRHPTCYVGGDVFDTLEQAQAELKNKLDIYKEYRMNFWKYRKTKNKIVITYYNGATDTLEIIERNI